MGVIRDRVAAGKKAALKNIARRPDYYRHIAKFKKPSGRAAKYGDLAMFGTTKRETIEWRVSVRDSKEPHELTRFFDTRKEARVYKRLLVSQGVHAFMTRFHTDGEYVVETEEVT